jgi:hypothetical protein
MKYRIIVKNIFGFKIVDKIKEFENEKAMNSFLSEIFNIGVMWTEGKEKDIFIPLSNISRIEIEKIKL